MNLTVIIILLTGMIVCAVACIVLSNLVKAGVAMAATSAILSIVMFMLKAPLAAAFELSVCAGLIPVIFMSTISMTNIKSQEELKELKKERKKKFLLFPLFLIILAAVLLALMWPYIVDFSRSYIIPAFTGNVRDILWNNRQIDLLGQIIIILAGVFGVIIFFKESVEE